MFFDPWINLESTKINQFEENQISVPHIHTHHILLWSECLFHSKFVMLKTYVHWWLYQVLGPLGGTRSHQFSDKRYPLSSLAPSATCGYNEESCDLKEALNWLYWHPDIKFPVSGMVKKNMSVYNLCSLQYFVIGAKESQCTDIF